MPPSATDCYVGHQFVVLVAIVVVSCADHLNEVYSLLLRPNLVGVGSRARANRPFVCFCMHALDC